MKVYEVINKLKGTDATPKQIANWAYLNRVLPFAFEDDLDLEEGVTYPPELEEIAFRTMNETGGDGYTWIDAFLNAEVENDT